MLPCGGPQALEVPAIAKFYSALRDTEALSYYVPDVNRGTVLVAVPALIDLHKAASTMTEAESSIAQQLSSEWLFRHCDEVTRRTGYLTKMIRLIDLKGIKLSGMNREFQRRDANNSKTIEDVYPQLLGAVYYCISLPRPGLDPGLLAWGSSSPPGARCREGRLSRANGEGA